MATLGHLNITGVVKEDPSEVYVVIFLDDRREEALRTFGRWASNPNLSFTWYDAAVASQRIAQEFAR